MAADSFYFGQCPWAVRKDYCRMRPSSLIRIVIDLLTTNVDGFDGYCVVTVEEVELVVME